MKRFFSSREYRVGRTIFFSGAAIILFYLCIKNLGEIRDAINVVINILSPFIMGMVIAYLVCPVYNVCVRRSYKFLSKRMKSCKKAFTLSRVIGSVASFVFLIAVIGAFFSLMIPQIFRSTVALIEIMPGRVDQFTGWLQDILGQKGHEQLAGYVSSILSEITDRLIKWSEDSLFSGVSSIVSRVSLGVIATLKMFFNFIVGIIVSIYLLNSKEHFRAAIKKYLLANVGRDNANRIFEFGNFCNRTFGGFINGKIIDSILVGFICYAVMLILRLPCPVLISTIIAATNIIPFFGPFIGAIPSAIIICIVDPVKALYFLIMVVVLQQFDGNVLGPKILGKSTGLASFWVMFAIIVGGGFFGVIGMILGVPTFAVILYYIEKRVKKKLKNKGFDQETDDYIEFNKYDINRKDVL